MSSLSADSVAVILFESMIDAIPYSSSVTRILLNDMISELEMSFQRYSSELSLFDVVVLIISFSVPSCLPQVQRVLELSLKGDFFPTENLIVIIERRKAHEVCRHTYT